MWTRSVEGATVAAPLPLLALMLLLSGPGPALAFNVLKSGAIVVSPGHATSDEYFGYTVALTTIQDRPWMMVSAPRANSSFENKRFSRTGSLYRCSPTDGNCKEINLSQGWNSETNFEHHLNVDNGTLGGSMDALLGNDGIVVCNPSYKDIQDNLLDMPGICYWLHDMTTADSQEIPKRKLKSSIDGRVFYNIDGERWKDDHGSPQLGFSIHQLTPNNSLQQFLIGGPGLFAGRGTVALFLRDFRRLISEEYYGVAIHSLKNDSYFGYSVTAGRYNGFDILYAGSAPREEDLHGKVIVFDYQSETNDRGITAINIKKELHGEKMGEYFGASLVSADINNDGIDELLVGAPLHGVDEGKVYIFSTSGKNKNDVLDIKEEIMPKTTNSNARYGTAIASLGDIDKDGFTDIAIGAPYEDSERGAIYLYYGSAERPFLKHEKHIQAAELDISLRGFGFSFSRGGDVDSNSYNDFGVGAFLSDKAVIMRTSPVLRFNSSARIKSDKIPMNANNVIFQLCSRPNELLNDTGVEVILNLDPIFNRGSIDDRRKIKYTLNMTAGNVKDECRTFEMVLKNRTKIYKPFEIEMSYGILYPKPKSEQFCKTCPILDFKSPKTYHYLHYQTDCADQICKTNLTLNGNFTDVRSPFIVGSNNKSSIEMVVEVANLLEPSYETNISITFSSAVQLRQSHQSCYRAKTNSTDFTNLLCEVPYMLDKRSQPFSLNISFDMDSIPWDINQLQVNISVEGSGEEQYIADDRMTLLLELHHIANISMRGRSSAENIVFASKQNDSDDYSYFDRTFEHIYTVINNGPSPVHGLNLKFLIPYKLKEGGEDVTYLTVIPNAPQSIALDRSKSGELSFSTNDEVLGQVKDQHILNLDCASPEVECMILYYNITGTLYSKRGVTISFKITSLLKTLGPTLKQSGLLVKTKGTIENDFIWDQDLGGKTYFSAEAETLLTGRVISQDSVQNWIIIVAIICGIIILAVLCVILWKLGFFKRNKPPTEVPETEKPVIDGSADAVDKEDTDPLYGDNP